MTPRGGGPGRGPGGDTPKNGTRSGADLYIVLVSLHGLIRAEEPELGRDADTGGQVLYVLELARALARHPEVGRVDLLTRQVFDPKVGPDYARAEERLAPNAYLVRIPFGPRRYLRKEVLWPYLDSFVDNAVKHLRRVGRSPDVIHSHYADAGYAGSRLAQLLGVPLVHTGHSLGRVKRERLLAKGIRPAVLENQYNLNQRIEAEEITLGNAALVIASTTQEVEEQYSQYENYHPKRMVVIPPGVDLERFHPPGRDALRAPIVQELKRFLRHPRRPMVLALARPDERKNLPTLVRAYAEHPQLPAIANLVIVAGNRDDIRELDKGAREVLTGLLLQQDRYDLYGRMALPKHHEPSDVPDLYRAAAATRGVFVNPALTEPFGLTLIEAAASGLPVVATEDGGPRDILAHCRHGSLVDPLDARAMGEAIHRIISDRRNWRRLARNGVRGAARHYTWEGHVEKYVALLKKIAGKRHPQAPWAHTGRSRMPSVDRLLVCDVDNTLLGDRAALRELVRRLQEQKDRIAFGVATGRHLESTLAVLAEWGVPVPDLLITSVGSEIFYGHGMVADKSWADQLDYLWRPDALRRALRGVPGLRLQPADQQGRYKLSYFVDPQAVPRLADIRRLLRQQDLHAKLVYSHQAYLDLLPVRASKGLAIRHLAMLWDIEPESILAAGDSGNDEEMLRGNTLGVVVGNYSPELERLRRRPRVYFARAEYARGILEGIDYYDFFGRIRIPEPGKPDPDANPQPRQKEPA